MLSLLAWLYLLLGRSGFWRAQPRLDGPPGPTPTAWPAVVAIIPARNEAESIAAAVTSLLTQDYAGQLTVIVVDDHCEDATAAIAAGLEVPRNRSLEVIAADELQPGWTGKLWAIAEGLRRADDLVPEAPYVLLTDADIAHDPHNLALLVAKAVVEERDLVSLMVKLRCQSSWERLLIPPFVFFFQMLYPFPAVNRPGNRTAAAAGGCMLIRRATLRAAGGIAAIRDRLIDDVALAHLIKHRTGGGEIWLGLTAQTV
ncbi:MAG: glycosyltransferase, partial [Nitrospirota bacterium]|nr:glycosyltransferase [Nitrospirota bacterium]